MPKIGALKSLCWGPLYTRAREDDIHKVLFSELISRQTSSWTFRIFLIFSARGRGRGSPRCQEGAGVGFSLKIPGGGGSRPRGVGEGVAGRVSAKNSGGRLIFFFFGKKRAVA